jgi:uncharacterized membrane protein
MKPYLLGALLSALLWILLAFVAAIPSGWVHVPLVAAVLLLVRAIVGGQRK